MGISRKRVLGLAISLGGSLPVYSQTELVVAVQADRIQAHSSATALVFEREEIQQKKSRDLGEFLRSQPGFQLSANFQGISTGTIRGLPGGNVLVFWNGVKLNDPLDPTVSFDFSRISTAGVDRIEIIRGPEAAIYGSEARGAVIFVTSDRESKKLISGEVEAHAGSLTTGELATRLYGQNKSFHYTGFAKIYSTRGMSAADSALGNTERDGKNSQQLLLSGDYKASDKWNHAVTFMTYRATNDADLRGGSGGDDPTAEDTDADLAAHLQSSYRAQANIENRTALSLQKKNRRHKNSVEYGHYDSFSATVQNETHWNFSDRQQITGALEFTSEKADSSETTGMIQSERHSAALRALYTADWQPFKFRAGGRLQKNMQPGFASAESIFNTFFINPSYQFVSAGTWVGFSVGRSFKSPSLYQLFSRYGSPQLKTEKMWAYEINFLQQWQVVNSQLSVTYFWQHLYDVLDFDLIRERYANYGERENYGLETTFETQWNRNFKSRFEYTWTHTTSLRVAEHKANASIDWEWSPRWWWGAGVQYIGERTDVDAAQFFRKQMPGFLIVNSRFAYTLSQRWQAHLNVDNLFNRDYEEIDGFGTSGRYIELGARFNF